MRVDSIIVTSASPLEQEPPFVHLAGICRWLASFVPLREVNGQGRAEYKEFGLSDKLRRRKLRTNEVLGGDRNRASDLAESERLHERERLPRWIRPSRGRV
jgi:hypothetical protein